MGALGEVLGVELQPEELLRGAVEAPWEEEGDEVSSGTGEEVEGLASLQPGGPTPKRLTGRKQHLGRVVDRGI